MDDLQRDVSGDGGAGRGAEEGGEVGGRVGGGLEFDPAGAVADEAEAVFHLVEQFHVALFADQFHDLIKTYKDLNDPQYRITSKIGTTGEMVAKKLISKAKYNGFDNEQEAVLDVVNGKADAFIYDAPYNVVAVNKAGAGKLVYLDEPFTYEPLAFGLKKGDYDSINWINNWLQQIRHDGTYDRLHAKWFKSTAWLKDME